MSSPALPGKLLVHLLLLVFPAQAPLQDTTPATPTSKVMRIPEKQEHLCCYDMHFVKPVYPKDARLAHIEGLVKLHLVFADDGSIAELQAVSGDPLLVDSAMKAVRQWRVAFSRVVGRPVEHEIALTFTFRIQDPPTPAYLHLANGAVIRAEAVREFTDRIEYTVNRQTHRIAPNLVTDVNACARLVLHPALKEGECIPSGGPSFIITALPLMPSSHDVSRSDAPATQP